jgi:hypothetical protein
MAHVRTSRFWEGVEGTATMGSFVTDWIGFPPYMHSRIIVEPMILPSSIGDRMSQ